MAKANRFRLIGLCVFSVICIWGYTLIYMEHGKSPEVNTNADLSDFDAVELNGGATAYIRPDLGYNIRVEGTDKFHISVQKNKLTIKCGFACSRDKEATVYVGTPFVDKISVLNGGLLTVKEGFQDVDKLTLSAVNGGSLSAESILAEHVTASSINGGNITLSVQDDLTASAVNGGNIVYYGKPRTSISAVGGGNVTGK